MSWTELSGSDALSAGTEMWILPDLQNSNWTKKIDWYLNFQIIRADHHVFYEPSVELLQTAEVNEFDIPAIANRMDAPLLIASEGLLPNRMTVCLSFANAGSLNAWVKGAQELVAQIGSSSFRVFLPREASLHEFQNLWPLESAAQGVVRDASSASVLATSHSDH